MANNTTLPGTGAVIHDLDRSGVKTQIMALDLNPAGAEQLMAGTMPATLQPGTADVGKVDATGTKVTAAAIPTGGVGFLGWLSAIFWQLTQILTFKIDQTTPGTTNKVNIGTDGVVELGSTSLTALETITVASVTAPIPSGANLIGRVGIDQTTPGTTNLVAAGLVAGENVIGKVGGILDNPTSTLTRPNDTTAYAQNDLIASSTTAGSVSVPSITVARVAAGSFALRRIRLSTNKTSGWDAAQLRVRFWATAPTFTNGDNGAYAVTTGAAGYLGQMDVLLSQFADGAVGVGVPSTGGELGIKLASGQVVYWDLQIVSAAALTPASGQTFTLTGETYQN